MTWKLKPAIEDILKKGENLEDLTTQEALDLMALPLESPEVYALMQTADAVSRKTFGKKGENHFHIGLNVEQCPYNCLFCSLTQKADVFQEKIEFSKEQIIAWAKSAEKDGADGLNLMTTGTYGFKRLLEIGRLLKKTVSTPLVANTRDITHKEGEALLEAGFQGAYHAVRLGEGRDTPFKREKRIATIQVFSDVGLSWANCVEPVGPEHSHEEIVDLMFLAKKHKAAYSGIMRRINFPGSPMEKFGMITEREMARMVAVSRLVMADVPKAHCTHEPHTASLMAGANLFFPEVGASPRDREAETGQGRGNGIDRCKAIHWEMGLDPDLPSNVF
ncbi:radical SAM domain protein [Desulfatibacillum aliphaticivorans]|uniref:Radical SAM domain protein n=1 Tax=Desulfatibacillum aliphaticivorans TaxID=218208 RepID=B8FLR7_DESAL|nr:radical SAM protein [Desulfatibacillum aliphaticivorans]ACL05421.1 radical SAM domain protein [Desulfatibacillum aliphaticivorans]